VRRRRGWLSIDCLTRILQVNAAAKRSGWYAENWRMKTTIAAEFL
jgi:hypothetical protein